MRDVMALDGRHIAVVGAASAARLRPCSVRGMTEYWAELGIFGVASVGHETYFYTSTHRERLASALDERDPARFRDAWARVLPMAGRVLATFGRVQDLIVNEVIRVDCSSWYGIVQVTC
jgi:hypothetical protein